MNKIERVGDTAPIAWRDMREQATALVSSGFLKDEIRTPEQAIAIMMTGRELGLGPMQALNNIHIIKGKPTLSADLMAGLALQRVPGSRLTVTEATGERVTIEGKRHTGDKAILFTWTLQMARDAGLLSNASWKKYPRAMLMARAKAEAARALFPDVLMGFYTPDEIGAATDASGDIVSEPVEATQLDLDADVDIDGHVGRLKAAKTTDEVNAIAAELKALGLSRDGDKRAKLVALCKEALARSRRLEDAAAEQQDDTEASTDGEAA